jgi:adenylate kinase
VSTVYLTGLATTGEISLAQAVKKRVENVEVLGYSDLLRDHLSARVGPVRQTLMRQQSSRLVTPEDAAIVDRKLVQLVNEARNAGFHVIVDSHAVTSEEFGFRVTPFSVSLLNELEIDLLVCLYADPDEILERSRDELAGRIALTSYSVSQGLNLQNCLVLMYGLLTGTALHFLNSSMDIERLADWMALRLRGGG